MVGKDWDSIMETVRKGRWGKILAAVYRPFFRSPPEGVVVPEEEWDYLIVLDACRYDAFKKHNTIEGDLEKKVSRGSTSIEYFNRNFTEYYDDIVYVSANGFTAPVKDGHYQRESFNGHEHFHDIAELYLEDDPYDDRKMTPRYVLERAEEVVEEYPHKRVAVHLMSPHSPYIGPSAPEEPLNIRDYRDRGYSWEEIWALYIEEVEQTLDRVQKFIDGLEGRIVITADHGEAFGEYRLAAHPHGVYIKELIEVPWLVIDQGERPEIREEDVSGIDI